MVVPERNIVDFNQLERNGCFNNTFDKCIYYYEHDKNKSYPCEPADEVHSYIVPYAHKASSMPAVIYVEWLLAVNTGIKKCKLNATNFYEQPGSFVVSEETKKSTGWSEDDFYE